MNKEKSMYGLVEVEDIQKFCAFRATGTYRGSDHVFEVSRDDATHMIIRGDGEPATGSGAKYLGTVADLALRHVAQLGQDVSEDVKLPTQKLDSAMLVAEIESATIADFEADLEAALADYDACLVQPAAGHPWLFLSQRFLEKFQEGDGVKVARGALSPEWGRSYIHVRLEAGHLQLTSYYQKEKIALASRRGREIYDEVDELAAELRAARQYRRQYKATVSEVIF